MTAREGSLAILPNGTLSLDARVEALLFVAEAPPSIAQLARALEVPPEAVEEALQVLQERLRERGLRLQRKRDRVQLVTAPEAAEDVRRFLGLNTGARLSTAALETLAIIAYRQPITRAEIEAIRGVNCEGVLRTLLAKGLIEEVDRAEGPGRPIRYGTTFLFLQHFGLRSLADLPPLDGTGEVAGPSEGSRAPDVAESLSVPPPATAGPPAQSNPALGD